jgi:hypothetical protein
MDFAKQGVVYILMVIPTMFALTVLAQGITKLSQNNPDGKTTTGFGVFLIILIATAYFLFIR